MHVARGGSNHRRINRSHGTSQCEQNGRQPFHNRTRWSPVQRFPSEHTVVHGDECSIRCDQTPHNGSLVHGVDKPLTVFVGFAHPSTGK